MKDKPLILIVDDITQNIQLLGTILKGDYEIAVSTSGKGVFEILKDIVPDLILLDIMMPHMSGFEVCALLKKDKRYKDIPIIFLTAKNEQDDIITGFKLGAVDYITKPFRALELLIRVKNHIELKKQYDEQKKLVKELKDALEKVKTLSNLLPICSNCKKIRDDKGYWTQVEEYLEQQLDASFTHALCPDCVVELYPQLADDILDDDN